MKTESLELLRGTLDLLILRALKVEGTHGYGVLRWIERATGDELRIEEGSLYPALYRLEKRDGSRPSGDSRRTTGAPGTTS